MLIFSFLLSKISSAHAQQRETQAWIFITHSQKLNKRFDLLLDIQGRTADRLDYANTLLARTALNYNFNDKHAVALGYAHKADREIVDETNEYTNENRVYEQYLYQFKISNVELVARARLEQRWIREKQTDFSQRARAFLSIQIPFSNKQKFDKGIYAAAQNEIFLNVTNKENINGRTFDQNRSFLSFGYRWNKTIDTEVGYMHWYQRETDDDFRRGVIQLQITTSF